MASTWMDDIRSDSTYDYASDWHWVTVQDGQTYAVSEKNPKGDVIETIERIIADLKSKKLNRNLQMTPLQQKIVLLKKLL